MSDETLDDHPRDSGSDELPSVVVNGDDSNSNATSSNSSVAKGLSSMISSIITDFDSKAEATSHSQEQLAFSLDRLTGGTLQTPSNFLNFKKASSLKGLVIISATCSCELQYTNSTTPSFERSRRK
ncbi:Biogenesis of lysosome-related organelles complex 1 subunit 7 [Abeliophyllum distichum]|uniref:Biogenesis of lysosome-related organelles complex 1 subunit 7 n=1 Tax=Abeliophyllum distichum TaxID=126358 RepID=A0ABD1PSW6_9LAMI